MNDSRSHQANDGANIIIIFLLRKYFAAKFTKNIPEFDTDIGLPSDKFLDADAAIPVCCGRYLWRMVSEISPKIGDFANHSVFLVAGGVRR